MRIRMKTGAAGPGQPRVYRPGAVVRVPEDVDQETALAWLNGGYAVAVRVHDVERAVVEDGPETGARAEGREYSA